MENRPYLFFNITKEQMEWVKKNIIVDINKCYQLFIN